MLQFDTHQVYKNRTSTLQAHYQTRLHSSHTRTQDTRAETTWQPSLITTQNIHLYDVSIISIPHGLQITPSQVANTTSLSRQTKWDVLWNRVAQKLTKCCPKINKMWSFGREKNNNNYSSWQTYARKRCAQKTRRNQDIPRMMFSKRIQVVACTKLIWL